MPALTDIADDLRWADADLANHGQSLELKIARAHLALAIQQVGVAAAARRRPIIVDHLGLAVTA